MPSYGGPLDGLPLNIESLVRRIEAKFGDDINVLERMRMPLMLHRVLDGNEDYWERGAGSDPPSTSVHYDNVGIYGWDVRDALSYTAARAAARASAGRDDDLFGVKPARDNDIAAQSVLAPFGVDATQVDAVRWHGDNGGIGTLIVALGANNALDAIVRKQRRVVGRRVRRHRREQRLQRLASDPLRPGVRRPRRRAADDPGAACGPGHGAARDDRPARPRRQPGQPGGEVASGIEVLPVLHRSVDRRRRLPPVAAPPPHPPAGEGDRFGDRPVQRARSPTPSLRRRRDGRDWFVLDLCGLLDSLAYRRFEADPQAARLHDWVPYELPQPIDDLDTRFFRSDVNGRRQGGLIGLDGIHPTTSGYGIVAQEVLDVLAVAGVPSTPIDFAALLDADTLNSDPPVLVDEVFELIAPFAARWVSRQ